MHRMETVEADLFEWRSVENGGRGDCFSGSRNAASLVKGEMKLTCPNRSKDVHRFAHPLGPLPRESLLLLASADSSKRIRIVRKNLISAPLCCSSDEGLATGNVHAYDGSSSPLRNRPTRRDLPFSPTDVLYTRC